MIRLSISGSHSVGKTVLAEEIYEYYKDQLNVVRITEIARILINRGFKLNKDITEYGIINYALEYLKKERKSKADIVISDRSIIDLLSYIKVNKSDKIRKPYISLIEEIVYMEKNRFDLYLYLPIEFPLQIDDVRPSDVKYQQKVDDMILKLLSEYNTNWYEIKGSVKERLEKSVEIIDEHHK